MPGGVCAVLDYEVDVMAEYVVDMAVRLVTPESVATLAFHKFATQILTSTRLPSTTILLGLNYLAKHIHALKTQGRLCEATAEGQVWRYLTVSFLLGSKFLDDNTFQNRSWSEVSGIPISELNALEFEWVQAMDWGLFVNLDLSKDYKAWIEHWQAWQATKKRQVEHANRERLGSLIAEATRHRDSYQPPHSRDAIAEFERLQAAKTQQYAYRALDSQWTRNPWSAPLTPPDSGYGTPEYVMSATSSNARYNEWFAQAAAQHSNRQLQAPAQALSYQPRRAHHAPNFTYGREPWDHGISEYDCPGCGGFMSQTQYFPPHAYGQPVVG